MKRQHLIMLVVFIVLGMGLSSCSKNVADTMTDTKNTMQEIDISSCEAISDERKRDFCLSDTAIERGSSAICQRIDDSGFKDACYSGVAIKTGDASLCRNDKTSPDTCYHQVAVLKGDATVCQKIKDRDYRAECVEAVREWREILAIHNAST